jgi:hypothetical protein
MICFAFFFLCRPGEYTVSPKPDSYLENAQLFVGNACLDMLTCSDQDLDSATFVSLTFTNHQNCVRGVRTVSETKFLVSASVVVPSTASFTTLPAALKLLASKVPSPQRHASYRLASGRWSGVSPAHVTSALRVDVTTHGPRVGFLPKDSSASALHADGAMALLCARVDTDLIQLLGRPAGAPTLCSAIIFTNKHNQ